MFLKNGQPITLTNGMVIDDVQLVLPLSAERLLELGIEEVPDPVRPDDRFHWVHPDGKGGFTSVPKARNQRNAVVWELIKAKRDGLRQNGGVKLGSLWFRSDDRAVSEYASMRLIGAELPENTVLRADWRTLEDGVVVDMTPALVKQVLVAGFAQIAAIDDAALAHKIALESCPDPSVYDYSGGWPEVFTPAMVAES